MVRNDDNDCYNFLKSCDDKFYDCVCPHTNLHIVDLIFINFYYCIFLIYFD